MADNEEFSRSIAASLSESLKDIFSPLVEALDKNTAAKQKPPAPPKDPFKEALKEMEKQIKEYTVKQDAFNTLLINLPSHSVSIQR
jgi:hypothetical protein